MTNATKALFSKWDRNNASPQAVNIAPRRAANRWWLLGLLCAGLISGVWLKAEAAPEGEPTANKVYYNCTFSTDPASLTGDIRDALNIPGLNKFVGNDIQVSYIIIYVRANPNDGQALKTPANSFTGPILCTNSDTNDINTTTEGTAIPGPVDITSAEESSHLQFKPTSSTNPADKDKRVCHTVASNTDCFLIQSKP
jgi:hypothetical protein